MSVPIVSRKQWGAKPWRSTVHRVALSEKDNFLVHYHGGKPAAQRGVMVPRNVEVIHLANGWAGVGYNFLVDMDGTVYEGRGWDGVGSQCPGFNRSGVGVYVAVGGDQVPTQAALRSVRALRDELVSRRGGAGVREMGHRDGIATSCPGAFLYKWVHAGMPLSGGGGMTAPINTGGGRALVPYPGHVHHADSRDDHHVEQIQKRITQLGHSLTADGKFGSATDRGVRWFQKSKGLAVDGRVGPKTWAALKIYNRA